jgi:hypothetical protein
MTIGLISGAIVMGNLIAGLFFLKFWASSQDRLFLIFAIAFWILATQRVLLALLADDPNTHVVLYGIRLLAFLLILVAIVDKNRETSERASARRGAE